MAALVIAEHDNQSLKAATLNAVAAALQCSPEVDVLVAGNQSAAAAAAAAPVVEEVVDGWRDLADGASTV